MNSFWKFWFQEASKAKDSEKEELPDFLKEPVFDKNEENEGFGWKKKEDKKEEKKKEKRKGTKDRKRKTEIEEAQGKQQLTIHLILLVVIYMPPQG